jgi:polyisoprenoid-binding protein YceI
MKLQFLSATLLAGAFLASCGGNETDNAEANTAAADSAAKATAEVTYAVSTDQSNIRWEGVMLGVKKHHGNVKFTDGTVIVAGGQLVGGNFNVDLNTISPLDSAYAADTEKQGRREDLVGHLKSPDFFDVANHPNAKLRILNASGNTANAELTIRGITHPETIQNVQITENNGELRASGELTFDRTKYDVKFQMPAQDMVINNDIKLNIELVGRSQNTAAL